jgi:hypothetical protein
VALYGSLSHGGRPGVSGCDKPEIEVGRVWLAVAAVGVVVAAVVAAAGVVAGARHRRPHACPWQLCTMDLWIPLSALSDRPLRVFATRGTQLGLMPDAADAAPSPDRQVVLYFSNNTQNTFALLCSETGLH